MSDSRVLAAAEDVADEPALLIGQRAHEAVPQHLGEADDGVERRAELVGHVGQELGLHPARVFELDVLLLQCLLETLQLGHVPRRGEHALKLAVAIVERRRVVGDDRQLAVPRARGELVVGDLALGQHAVDAGLGAAGVGEVALEGAPMSSSRVHPVSASICLLTSVMMPRGSVVISASMFDSMSERV